MKPLDTPPSLKGLFMNIIATFTLYQLLNILLSRPWIVL